MVAKKYQARYPGLRALYLLFPLLALSCLFLVGYSAYSFIQDVQPERPVAATPPPTAVGLVESPDTPGVVVPGKTGNGPMVAVPVGSVAPPRSSSGSAEKTPLEVPGGKIPNGIWVRVIKSQYLLYLYDGTTVTHSFDVGVGRTTGQKKSAGDGRTPEGRFSIQQIQDSRGWSFDYKDGKGPIKGTFGPWFLRLKAGSWKGLGICGTHDSSLLGRASTGGVIRLSNEALAQVKKAVKVGTIVVIEP